MKKFLTVLGGIFLALVVIGGISYAVLEIKGNKLDAESKAYAEATMPPLLSNFTSTNFMKYVAPQYIATIKRDDLEKFTQYVNTTFGHYKSFHDLKGESYMNVQPGGAKVSAVYFAKVDFDKAASVPARMILVKPADAWSLVRIDFDAKSLPPQASSNTNAPGVQQ